MLGVRGMASGGRGGEAGVGAPLAAAGDSKRLGRQ